MMPNPPFDDLRTSTSVSSTSLEGSALSLREDFLRSAFSQVLQRGLVAGEDDFFGSGGDSLKATMVLVQLRERLDATFAARSFFELRTAARLASAVKEDSCGLDIEELEGEPISGLTRCGSSFERARAHEPLTVASFDELGVAVRAYSGAQGLAPAVVFLSAWLAQLSAMRLDAFPLLFQVATGEACSGWLVSEADGPALANAPLRLQQRLLTDTGHTPTTAARSFFHYRTGDARAAVPAIANGLRVTNAENTGFALYGELPTALAASPEQLLHDYASHLQSRLAHDANE